MQPNVGPRDPWPDFVKLWQELLGEAESPGTVVLVEGERDRAALHALGVSGRIVLVHHGQSLSGVAREITEAGRRVIVLTDWDVEGGRLAQRLRELLHDGRLELDLDYRRRLARTLRGEIVHVEGLSGWANRMAQKVGLTLDEWLRVLRDGVA
jgi:5S rRNA maturation endonuclease (ribonuclease M5)